MIAFGTAMGALFAVAYALRLGRVGNSGPHPGPAARRSWVPRDLPGAVHQIPANPPSIGHAETIQARGGYYLLMVLASALLLIAAVWLGSGWRTVRYLERGAAGRRRVRGRGRDRVPCSPQLGHLAFNEQTYGNHDTESPLSLTNGEGSSSILGSPPTCCSSSGCTPSPAAPAVVGHRADLRPPRRPAAGSGASQRRTAHPGASEWTRPGSAPTSQTEPRDVPGTLI